MFSKDFHEIFLIAIISYGKFNVKRSSLCFTSTFLNYVIMKLELEISVDQKMVTIDPQLLKSQQIFNVNKNFNIF